MNIYKYNIWPPKEDLFNLYKTKNIKKEINFICRRLCVYNSDFFDKL